MKTRIDTKRKKRNLDYYLAVSVSLLTFIVYLTSLQNEFVSWDDPEYVTYNSHIRLFNFDLFRWAFSAFYSANWHPLTWISHALDYAVWGLNPLGHHLTNNILHAVNTFLVVVLVARLVGAALSKQPLSGRVVEWSSGQLLEVSSPYSTTQQLNSLSSRFTTCLPAGKVHDSRLTSHDSRFTLVAAATTGLLFGLHPLHVESAAWVSERKDLLCALFYLLSVMAYVQYATTTAFNQETEFHHRGTETQRESKIQTLDSSFSVPPRLCGPFPLHKHYLSALAFFALALLSKPMAVSLPVVLLILDWFPFGKVRDFKTVWPAVVEKLPFVVLSLISSALTILAQKGSEALFLMEVTPLSTRGTVAAKSLVAYLGKMMLPFHLSPFYPYPLDVTFFSIDYFLPIILVIGITILCLVLSKRQKMYFSAWSYYVVTLIPVLGIVQVGRQAMADRYTYLPSLGPFLVIGFGVAWVLTRASSSRRWSQPIKALCAIITVIAFVTLTYLTFAQIRTWKNSIVFWSSMIDNVPPEQILFAYNNRGGTYITIELFDKAIEDFNQVILIDPAYYEGYSNRGYAYFFKGQYDKAMKDYNKAIELNQNFAKAYFNRGNLYLKTGNKELAITDFHKACDLGDNEGCIALQAQPGENR